MTKRARGMKRAMAFATKVGCNEESDGFGGKSNGNEGCRRLMVTRVIATATLITWVLVMVMRLVGNKARVRVARAMATVMMMVVGNEEGMMMAARVMATETMVAGKRWRWCQRG